MCTKSSLTQVFFLRKRENGEQGQWCLRWTSWAVLVLQKVQCVSQHDALYVGHNHFLKSLHNDWSEWI